MASKIWKIAVVIPKYGLVGGAEGFAAELTERIALNDQYDIHVFTNRWSGPSDHITFHKVPVFSFPRFLTTISFAHFAGRKIQKMGFDLIHAHDRIFDADIFTMHGIPHRIWVREVRKKKMSLFDYGTEWVEKTLIENIKCKKFLPVSSLAKEKFLQAYPHVARDKVEVIHPGIDLERFERFDRQSSRREMRQRFGIDEKDIIILFVAMNFDIKGLGRLIPVVANARSQYPTSGFKLLVAGRDKERKYRHLAENLGIKDHVIFAGVQKEALEQIYLASDIFCVLSKFDTFGIVVLEAFAASLPVIVSSNVGAKDLVRDGVNGFVIENTEDTDSIVEKLGMMIDETVRTRMGNEACKTALDHTWEMATKRVSAVYEKILDR